jgi:hypothetical protein
VKELCENKLELISGRPHFTYELTKSKPFCLLEWIDEIFRRKTKAALEYRFMLFSFGEYGQSRLVRQRYEAMPFAVWPLTRIRHNELITG